MKVLSYRSMASWLKQQRNIVRLWSWHPGHAGMRVNYAIALLKLGRWEQGLEELRAAIRQDPSNQKFQ